MNKTKDGWPRENLTYIGFMLAGVLQAEESPYQDELYEIISGQTRVENIDDYDCISGVFLPLRHNYKYIASTLSIVAMKQFFKLYNSIEDKYIKLYLIKCKEDYLNSLKQQS